jgi:hypothetical protein
MWWQRSFLGNGVGGRMTIAPHYNIMPYKNNSTLLCINISKGLENTDNMDIAL